MLLAQLITVFSATPPVYAKPAETPRPTTNGQAAQASGSQNTYRSPTPAMRNPPVCLGSFVLVFELGADQQNQPPPPPARPFSGMSNTPVEVRHTTYE
jgi:hypothetical protein